VAEFTVEVEVPLYVTVHLHFDTNKVYGDPEMSDAFEADPTDITIPMMAVPDPMWPDNFQSLFDDDEFDKRAWAAAVAAGYVPSEDDA